MSFYAIARGRIPGIVSTWAECKALVDGFPSARYKKFASRGEADAFLTEHGSPLPVTVSKRVEAVSPALPSAFDVLMKPKARKGSAVAEEVQNATFDADYYVYTDGSCSNNGQRNALAGIGIYFGENDPRNVSQRVMGRQTNNTAEVGAIIHLHMIIKDDIQDGKRIGIVSDSEYAIRCVTSYGKKCEEKGWPDIPNRDLVKQLYQLYKGISNVKFFHIMAHTEKTDSHSVGNDGADRLANAAIGLEACPYVSNINKSSN
jgi:ribonuclease HI